jgi:hypothetical protein
MYRDERRDPLGSVEVFGVGPVYYCDLVGSEANSRLRERLYAQEL